MPQLIGDATAFDHENQFFRFQGRGQLGCHFFHGEVEGFAGDRIADWRQQDQLASTQPGIDAVNIDAPYLSGVLHVYAIQHA